MPLPGLKIIGESINDSVPSTKKLFEENNIAQILELAKSQDAAGANYIDVNVGRRTPEFMADMVKKIQTVTAKPLSIDTPDFSIAKAGLEAYDQARAGGAIPVLNSISPLRYSMLELYKTRPFMPLLLIAERMEDGKFFPNKTAQETYQTAKDMMAQVRKRDYRIPNEQCIFDPGISPVGVDTEGHILRVVETLKLIHNDPDFKGCHCSVGLSNFTHMLPSKRPDGSPVKGTLESAFLTVAMPLGLDTIIGSMTRKYAILDDSHPAMQCLKDVLKMTDPMDAIIRVKEFYTS